MGTNRHSQIADDVVLLGETAAEDKSTPAAHASGNIEKNNAKMNKVVKGSNIGGNARKPTSAELAKAVAEKAQVKGMGVGQLKANAARQEKDKQREAVAKRAAKQEAKA